MKNDFEYRDKQYTQINITECRKREKKSDTWMNHIIVNEQSTYYYTGLNLLTWNNNNNNSNEKLTL